MPGPLTRDAQPIAHLPMDPRPVVHGWSRGQDRAITVRLAGREVQAVAVEEYEYEDGRVAYRILPRDDRRPERALRIWWDDQAMRWGWLPAGTDARPAGLWHGVGQPRRRTWTEPDAWPPLWVHLDGRWQAAWLLMREDQPDGAVVYEIGVQAPGRHLHDLQRHRVLYDPRAVQERRPWSRENGSQA